MTFTKMKRPPKTNESIQWRHFKKNNLYNNLLYKLQSTNTCKALTYKIACESEKSELE